MLTFTNGHLKKKVSFLSTKKKCHSLNGIQCSLHCCRISEESTANFIVTEFIYTHTFLEEELKSVHSIPFWIFLISTTTHLKHTGPLSIIAFSHDKNTHTHTRTNTLNVPTFQCHIASEMIQCLSMWSPKWNRWMKQKVLWKQTASKSYNGFVFFCLIVREYLIAVTRRVQNAINFAFMWLHNGP